MNIIKEKSYYKTLVRIAIPVALQNLISFSVNMMDTLMLGNLGQLQLSSAALANQVFMFFSVICFGLASGGSVIVSQYWGKKDSESACKVMGISLKLMTFLVLFLISVIFFFPENIMSIYTNDAEIIIEGARYLKLNSLSFFFYGFASTFIISLRGIEQVKISIYIYGVSVFINIFFNYVFIFGKLGSPHFGIVGAAMGTLIARVFEFAMIILYITKFEKVLNFKFKYIMKNDKEFLKKYFKTSLPVVLNEILWGLGASTHAVIIGRLGQVFVAANSINSIMLQMGIFFIIGIGNAAAVITGKIVGSGDYEKAKTSARTLQLLSVVAGVFGGLFIMVFRNILVSFYNVEPDTKILAKNMMILTAVIIFFISMELISNIGILRGGGDTKFVFFVDVFFMWTIAIPIGAFGAFVLNWNPLFVYLALRLDAPLKALFAALRIKSGLWIKDVTLEKIEITPKN
ncbi:MAG: MATE family efflux transporter [Oscillospiraceae bacterium]